MSAPASVLLVDDDAGVRRVLAAALEDSEVLVVVGEAADGESALRLAREMSPDIVVLDLGLPDVSGRDLLTRLRELDSAVRVVVFTGDDSADADPRGLGVSGFVVKGDHLSRLLVVLNDVAHTAEHTATIDLERDPASVGRARRFTREQLEAWDAAVAVDNAVLVVSELVTNAITHGHSTCRVVLRRGTNSLRVEVNDFGSGSPEPQPPSGIRPSGRGLIIVSTVATAWGIDPAEGGKIVWAEIAD